MPYYCTISARPAGVRLPHHQATAAQRALAVAHLPNNSASGSTFPPWPNTNPNCGSRAVALTETDLPQLVQHLAAAPELPSLDLPLPPGFPDGRPVPGSPEVAE